MVLKCLYLNNLTHSLNRILNLAMTLIEKKQIQLLLDFLETPRFFQLSTVKKPVLLDSF
jgi:hypothetical protein